MSESSSKTLVLTVYVDMNLYVYIVCLIEPHSKPNQNRRPSSILAFKSTFASRFRGPAPRFCPKTQRQVELALVFNYKFMLCH